jgi:enoyl-CoA hydratase
MTDAILYENPAPHVARIVLNKPERHNAQDTHFLYALNDAFDRAAQDDEVKVIILAANGKNFSAGHDLKETGHKENWDAHDRVGTHCGFSCGGAETMFTREKEIYTGFCERWRSIPKPTIAAVQGKCISGGLMLIWPCDLIVCTEDALFQDNTLSMGVCGVEYFTHPWEVGFRRAKEMLFTSDWLTAEDAYRLGMVNRVVPAEALEQTVLDLAAKITNKSIFALKLAKEAVNKVQDAQGRVVSQEVAFAYHQLTHAHNQLLFGSPVDPGFVPRSKPEA